jgi:hypothetical protein
VHNHKCMEKFDPKKMLGAYEQADSDDKPLTPKQLEAARKAAFVKTSKESREAMLAVAQMSGDRLLEENAVKDFDIKPNLDELMPNSRPKDIDEIEEALEKCQDLKEELVHYLSRESKSAYSIASDLDNNPREKEKLILKFGTNVDHVKMLMAELSMRIANYYDQLGEGNAKERVLTKAIDYLRGEKFERMDKKIIENKIAEIEEVLNKTEKTDVSANTHLPENGKNDDLGFIKLPKSPEAIEKLNKKLIEYKQRLNNDQQSNIFKAPEDISESVVYSISDSEHKIVVLSHLLKNGFVNFENLEQELKNDQQFKFDNRLYKRACHVISDYCKTGGRNVANGTGF